VIGLDVDPRGAGNPMLDEFRLLAPGAAWPVADCGIDLILSDQVMEHLPDPAQFFAEARRVLRPGGYLCLRTPNANSYVGLAFAADPARLHARVLRKAQPRRKEEDVFLTLYRCNTIGRMRRMMRHTASTRPFTAMRRSRSTWRSRAPRTGQACGCSGWRRAGCVPRFSLSDSYSRE